MSAPIFRQSPSVVEGIGEAHASTLHAAGITTLSEMLRRTPEQIERLVPRASLTQIRGWFAAAWLLRVEGVTPDIAEALVAAGITGASALANAGLQTVERAIADAVAKKTLHSAPSLYKLAALQRSADGFRSTGGVYGKATNLTTGAPLAGVVISSGDHRTETDADGYFELRSVAAGRASLTVSSDRRRSTCAFFIKTEQMIGPLTLKITERAPAKAVTPVREADGAFVSPGRSKSVTLIDRKLEDMPNGTYLRVREISESGSVRLLHLFKTRVGREIQGDVVIIEKAQLPAGTKVGDILQYQDKALKLTKLSLRDVATQKLQNTFGNVKLTTVERVDPRFGM